jgi:hypothetical protein
VFVHDFVELDVPPPQVVEALTGADPGPLGRLVIDSWARTLQEWDGDELEPATGLPSPDGLEVTLGPLRARHRCSVLALSWPNATNPWFPSLDGDLEIFHLGPVHTNLGLVGRYRFDPPIDRWSPAGCAAAMVTVLTVRRFLTGLADHLTPAELEVSSVI